MRNYRKTRRSYEVALVRLYADLGVSPVDGSDLPKIITAADTADAYTRFYDATEGSP